jgi:hypothetical protein
MPRILVVVSLVCSLLVTAGLVTAADGKRRITMAPPAAGGGAVLLTGRVSSSDARVVLQRSADGRWVRVRTVPVRQHGYQTTVRARPRAQRFRVKAGDHVSQVRVVRPCRPTPTQDACGKRPRKPGGSRWSCTFVDDFEPRAVTVHLGDGVDLPPHQPALRSVRGQDQCHRDHRTRPPGGVPDVARPARGAPLRWPSIGEIDIAETYSQHPDLAIPFLHYSWNDNGGPQPGLNTAWDCPARRGVFNTYTLEWSATRIEIFVNGRSCLVNTSGDTAFQRKYILALTQALGVKRNRYQVNTPMPATMTIDCVRAWR